MAPEDQPAIREAHRRVVEEGAAYDIQFRVVRPDQTISQTDVIRVVILSEAKSLPLREPQGGA
ncbi:MAG: PAS domain-containing protein [Chloroflexi bacterium]|nr:PAS domain-containing protein [Chloroflexota bacterium]